MLLCCLSALFPKAFNLTIVVLVRWIFGWWCRWVAQFRGHWVRSRARRHSPWTLQIVESQGQTLSYLYPSRVCFPQSQCSWQGTRSNNCIGQSTGRDGKSFLDLWCQRRGRSSVYRGSSLLSKCETSPIPPCPITAVALEDYPTHAQKSYSYNPPQSWHHTLQRQEEDDHHPGALKVQSCQWMNLLLWWLWMIYPPAIYS